MAGNLNRRMIVPAALWLVFACACGREDAPAPGSDAAAGDAAAPVREGRLDLLMRAPVPAPGWARDFETQTACKLSLRSVPSAAELLAQAGPAEADLVLANGEVAINLVAAGFVQELEAARLPALAGIEAHARDIPGAMVSGRRYGAPWLWQVTGIAYDTIAFADAPPAWSDLYERRPRADADGAAGPASAASVAGPASVASVVSAVSAVSADDADGKPARLLAAAEPIAIADAALYLAATQPELRISDPYALDERQYAAVLALLRRQKPLLRGYGGDFETQVEAFRNGVVASPATPAQARALRSQGLPVAWIAPAGNSSAQVEIAMLHANARHPNCAYAFIEWALSPKSQAQLAAGLGALPLVAAACGLPPLAADDGCQRDGMALLPDAYLARVPQSRCGSSRCVPYSRWTRDYLALIRE